MATSKTLCIWDVSKMTKITRQQSEEATKHAKWWVETRASDQPERMHEFWQSYNRLLQLSLGFKTNNTNCHVASTLGTLAATAPIVTDARIFFTLIRDVTLLTNPTITTDPLLVCALCHTLRILLTHLAMMALAGKLDHWANALLIQFEASCGEGLDYLWATWHEHASICFQARACRSLLSCVVSQHSAPPSTLITVLHRINGKAAWTSDLAEVLGVELDVLLHDIVAEQDESALGLLHVTSELLPLLIARDADHLERVVVAVTSDLPVPDTPHYAQTVLAVVELLTRIALQPTITSEAAMVLLAHPHNSITAIMARLASAPSWLRAVAMAMLTNVTRSTSPASRLAQQAAASLRTDVDIDWPSIGMTTPMFQLVACPPSQWGTWSGRLWQHLQTNSRYRQPNTNDEAQQSALPAIVDHAGRLSAAGHTDSGQTIPTTASSMGLASTLEAKQPVAISHRGDLTVTEAKLLPSTVSTLLEKLTPSVTHAKLAHRDNGFGKFSKAPGALKQAASVDALPSLPLGPNDIYLDKELAAMALHQRTKAAERPVRLAGKAGKVVMDVRTNKLQADLTSMLVSTGLQERAAIIDRRIKAAERRRARDTDPSEKD
eukprot:TRINITY_DN11960_c0_g1_i1.p1 TRINITY_DN11960_c0_g1~~TRINITY_DN11960_c0_g1_i1.p1  ORF type:complete len:607 (+),score=109.41 TRINITY_DN11960_c0_g1_i1:176-1996(+)